MGYDSEKTFYYNYGSGSATYSGQINLTYDIEGCLGSYMFNATSGFTGSINFKIYDSGINLSTQITGYETTVGLKSYFYYNAEKIYLPKTCYNRINVTGAVSGAWDLRVAARGG